MRSIVNTAFRHYLKYRYKQVQDYKHNPIQTQESQLMRIINSARHTEWGRMHDFGDISSAKDYHKQAVIDYHTLEPYIRRMMHGEQNILVSGKVKWFSKSSGTTGSCSKYIPVPRSNLMKCHIKGTWDTMAMYYHNNPGSNIFQEKSLLMGGSIAPFDPLADTYIGDISAIMIEHLPLVGRPFYTPDFETALLPDWEDKIERMAHIISKDENLVLFGGVPTWVIVLFQRILDITGKDHMLDVWPNLECYTHGGVGFRPYRDRFRALIPSNSFQYVEVYNATEGYFAVQEHFGGDDMLLLLDNGIYFEFIPLDQIRNEHPDVLSLKDVEIGQQYAMVVTTSAGLWRYQMGDTIMFTSIFPFQIQVTGRTTQYVNAFGEEVIVANTDKAIAQTCSMLDARVAEYTMGPKYFDEKAQASHEWILEFDKAPSDIHAFNKILDANLKRLNSDYEAKRTKNLALTLPKIHTVPKHTFHNWLKSKGQFGGQHKVPRLSNDRTYVEEILQFVGQNQE